MAALLFGSTMMALDYGRLTLLRSQMQNAADAAALAAAAQLDGLPGALTRAEKAAKCITVQTTGMSKVTETDSNAVTAHKTYCGVAATEPGELVVIDPVKFYSEIDPPVETDSDQDAAFVQVFIEPQEMNLIFQPVLYLLKNLPAQEAVTLGGRGTATARVTKFVCNPPGIMLCDPVERGLPDIANPAAAGWQIKVALSGQSAAAGNFGFLCPSDEPCGADSLGPFLESEGLPDICLDQTIASATGGSFGPAENAINSRFDLTTNQNNATNPAMNIVSYPSDDSFDASDFLGDGDWNAGQYWNLKHNIDTLPPDLIHLNVTRLQVYFYELGATYTNGH